MARYARSFNPTLVFVFHANSLNAELDAHVTLRQCKYLNNIVEQNHRAVKRVTRPMLGFKSFIYAQSILAGIEIMQMIRKG